MSPINDDQLTGLGGITTYTVTLGDSVSPRVKIGQKYYIRQGSYVMLKYKIVAMNDVKAIVKCGNILADIPIMDFKNYVRCS